MNQTPEIKARVRIVKGKEPMLASVSFTIDGWLVLRDGVLRQGSNGPFVSFPSRKYETKEGEVEYSDYYFPISREHRELMFKAAWQEYEKALETA